MEIDCGIQMVVPVSHVLLISPSARYKHLGIDKFADHSCIIKSVFINRLRTDAVIYKDKPVFEISLFKSVGFNVFLKSKTEKIERENKIMKGKTIKLLEER